LFDFAQEIYGEHVKVRWHHFLRGEIKFTGMADLIDQLALDEEHSRAFFVKGE
jgi:riboflavin kinase/FMN adenylyltransferase